MRQLFCILVALMHSAAVALAGVIPFDPERRVHVASPVEPGESAALFVGIRDFLYDETLTEVKYGVDDAIDLAYVLAIERTPHLIEPKRIVLALSGDPQKPQSQRNLDTLRAAGRPCARRHNRMC